MLLLCKYSLQSMFHSLFFSKMCVIHSLCLLQPCMREAYGGQTAFQTIFSTAREASAYNMIIFQHVCAWKKKQTPCHFRLHASGGGLSVCANRDSPSAPFHCTQLRPLICQLQTSMVHHALAVMVVVHCSTSSAQVPLVKILSHLPYVNSGAQAGGHCRDTSCVLMVSLPCLPFASHLIGINQVSFVALPLAFGSMGYRAQFSITDVTTFNVMDWALFALSRASICLEEGKSGDKGRMEVSWHLFALNC